MQLQIKRLSLTAIIPQYAHPTDSGLDLHYSGNQVILPADSKRILETGISIQLPPGTEAQIRSRSGLAAKQGLVVLNSPGTIDEGYTGEIKVILYNTGSEHVTINPGDKIAQMVICPVLRPWILEVDELEVTARGDKGFGSTGVHTNE